MYQNSCFTKLLTDDLLKDLRQEAEEARLIQAAKPPKKVQKSPMPLALFKAIWVDVTNNIFKDRVVEKRPVLSRDTQ